MSSWMEHWAMYLNLEGRYIGVLRWHSVELWDKIKHSIFSQYLDKFGKLEV